MIAIATAAPKASPDETGASRARATARVAMVDVARGVALVAMAIYHTAWDLHFLSLAPVEVVDDPVWRGFAVTIAASFLTLVGISLVLATRGGLRVQPFLRRLALVAGAATAVTVATYVAMPDRFIFFGILHCIAVSSVLALVFVDAPLWLVAATAALITVVPHVFRSHLLEHPALVWLGIGTDPPETNDYVPLFPWFAAVLLGVIVARLALHARPAAFWSRFVPARAGSRALAFAGRHSLIIYLVHQPLIFGALWLVLQATGPSAAAEQAPIMRSCLATCDVTTDSVRSCRLICRCAINAVKQKGLWPYVVANTLSGDQRAEASALARQCRASALPRGGVIDAR